jgi:DNA-directed RNA polymerase specialized sigma24 family protein
MKQGFATDTVLLTLMRSEKTSDNDLALKQLLDTPLVKTGIEALFLDSNFEKYRIDYLCQKTFDALKERVKDPMKELKDTPTNLYVTYVRNLKEAEYIRMGQSPEMDNILKSLLTDGKVLGTIKSKINSHENIDPKEILSESIKALYEKITNGNFKGKSALKTYFIKICLNKISDIFNHKEIFVELDEDKIKPLWEGTKDPIEDLGVDFTVGFKESEKERFHFASIVQNLEITPKCRETLIYKYQKDYDMAQIAAKMNIAVQSAKNNSIRCKEQFDKAIAASSELKAFVKRTRLLEGFFPDKDYEEDYED